MAETPDCSQGRGSARCEAILLATLEVLSEVGYERLTIDAVATRARASKATIYRHWQGKAELTVEAIGQWPGTELNCPDTGSLRGDLLKVLRVLRERLTSNHGELLAGLLQVIQHDQALADALRAKTHCHATQIYRRIIERATLRGEISGCFDPELVLSVAPALIFYRHVFTGEPVNELVLTRLTDNVLLPLLQSHEEKAHV
ncbi:MAG: TetR/AcrR family transcriptional regulator [Sciscionella sp.]